MNIISNQENKNGRGRKPDDRVGMETKNQIIMKRIFYITIGLLSGLMIAGMLLPLMVGAQPAGGLDPTFGTDGIVELQVGTNPSYNTDYAFGVQVLPNDNILVVGDTYNGTSFNTEGAIVRLLPDGGLDASFGIGGIPKLAAGSGDVNLSGITVMADGKFVVVGRGYSSNGDFIVARFNADGTPDLTFNGTGHRITSIGTVQDWAYGVAVQADGKVVVSGSVTTSPSYTSSSLGIVRYNEDGTLDDSFGTGGIINMQIGNVNALGHTVSILPDGKIIVMGYAHNGTVNCYMALRLNTDGTLDGTFGTDGIALHPIGTASSSSRAGIRLPDGKLLLAGGSNNGSQTVTTVIRLNADGSLDGTFGTGGVATNIASANDQIHAMAVQPDGKIVVTGNSNPSAPDIIVLRFNADGSIDNSFGTAGVVVTENIGMGWEEARGVAVQSTGNIIVAGYHDVGGFDFAMTVLRYIGTGCAPIDVEITADGAMLTGPAGFTSYTWVDCATQMSLGSAQSFMPSVSGSYALSVTDADGCIGISECEAVVITGLGGSDPAAFSVYPNPASDLLRINGLNGPAMAEVMDMAGRTVMTSVTDDRSGIAIGHLASGSYLLRVTGQGGDVVTMRFVRE
jgi:uncharacterized delta-60 repeat protein